MMEDVHLFNTIMNESRKGRIDESSASRMLSWMKACDRAFISAYRNEPKDIRNPKATFFGPNGDWQVGKSSPMRKSV